MVVLFTILAMAEAASKVQSAWGPWQTAHATCYGGFDAAGTMGNVPSLRFSNMLFNPYCYSDGNQDFKYIVTVMFLIMPLKYLLCFIRMVTVTES